MPLVTVCVPAYRAAGFLPQTLGSIREQVFTDFVVRVAIEPDNAEGTLEACADFTRDGRFQFVLNEATLGWPGNVRQLLHEVRTPYFVVLPHDDLWHSEHLAALMGALASRPDAATVYCDSYRFLPPVGIGRVELADAPMAERLLSFFAGGAPGLPWRGLTRSDVLRKEFPDNDFGGFAVECEWVAHLILSGRVLRHPEPLYLKRARADDDPESVTSAWRFRLERETLESALANHRQAMLAVAAAAPVDEAHRRTIILAVETAMLIRSMIYHGARFDLSDDTEHRFEQLVLSLNDATRPTPARLLSRILVTRSRYLVARGRHEEAWACAAQAVDAGPDRPEALMQLARLLLRNERAVDALPLISRASSAAPMAVGLTEMQMECSRQLTEKFAFDVNRA